jgi:hypothetical protein
MADLLVHSGSYNADTGLPILEKWHDNGDGSYSRTLTTAGGSGGGAGAKGSKFITAPTIAATSTLLLAANANRISAIITNPKTAAQTLYIGVSGVTTSSYTVSLEPGDTYIDNDSSDAWYGVVASSTLVPNVTEVA